jgi:hypothetical protein
MHENPFASDNVGANGARDKIPGVVDDQGSKFLFHGATPVQIDEALAISLMPKWPTR